MLFRSRGVAGVEVIEMPGNRGLAAAANTGARRGDAPFILLANADTLPRSSIRALLPAFTGNVAVVAPRLINPDGSLQPSTHGDLTLMKAMGQIYPMMKRAAARLARLISRPGFGQAASFWNHDRRIPTEAAAGAFLLVRRSAWEEVGGMDEDFFLWHEDADLCRRLRGAGYRIIFDPALEVVHELGASRRMNPEAEAARLESQQRYARRHWGGLRRLLLAAAVKIGQ